MRIAMLAACCAFPSYSFAAPEEVDALLKAALSMDANPARGATLYKDHCVSCHGARAEGNAAKSIPSLAAQRQSYLIKQLADFSEEDRDGDSMLAVLKHSALKPPQAWVNVAAYLNGLAPTAARQKGSGAKLLLGEAIFREQCSTCHEEDARGDDDGFVPALRNQHYGYLLKQLRGFRNWHRRNVEEDLLLFFQSLDQEELTSVADYLSRLQGPARDRTTLSNSGTAGD